MFDVGAKGKILLNNMQRLEINPRNINKIVISHEHWDHNGGLKSLSSIVEDVELYRLGKTEVSEKIKTITVEGSQIISERLYTTGRLDGPPVDEQSLVLQGADGWYVLVGCSHSGVENILKSSKKFGQVLGIIGGLHGFNDYPVLKDLDFICPCHCTEHMKKIRRLYPKTVIVGGVGKYIEL